MKKKIYLCPNCRRALNFSDNTEYTFYCMYCDEHFHDYEADTEEQARMEGIIDYTELIEASIKVKEITETTIKENKKCIKIKGESIIEQIAEYIHETIAPVLSTNIYKDHKFIDASVSYNRGLILRFNSTDESGNECGACLSYMNAMVSSNTYPIAYFYANGYRVCPVRNDHLTEIIPLWSGFKDSMNRHIPYALDECNKANQKKLEKQKEMAEIINNFRL